MKRAIVHDWLIHPGGAEKVFELMLELFPADIFTLIKSSRWKCEAECSFLQKLPFIEKYYRSMLPLLPYAIEQFDVSSYDLVLSFSHAVAKGVITHAEQLHICYCHTPMRWAWDQYHSSVRQTAAPMRGFAKMALHYLRQWDLTSSQRVDHYIANSHFVKRRIKKIYGRDAAVIYPPVATHLFQKREEKEEFYVAASRLVPAKRIDLIVEAFSYFPQKKLVVIGAGREMARLKKMAGKNVELLGYVSDEQMRSLLGKAKGFLFAAEEDFGILPVEAQAAGTPVIAFGRGGSRETVVEGETGLFFAEQTVPSIVEAIGRFERRDWDPDAARANAERFSEENFKMQYNEFVEQKWQEFNANRCCPAPERKADLMPG